MDPIASLAREPIVVDGVKWQAKAVRTGGASGRLHDEWALLMRFSCQVPFRGAVFLDCDGVRRHARDWSRHATRASELKVTLMPYDWDRSDTVELVASDGVRMAFESALLKLDPAAATTVGVQDGGVGFTGEPVTILTIPEVGASLGVLFVRSTDTTADRTRWRVRDEHLGGLGDFAFLATGRRAGSIPMPA